jgi:ATP synthase protein I
MSAEQKHRKTSILLIGVGTMLTSTIVAGFLLGYGLDWWLGTEPIFMLVLGGLGFIGGLLKVYKILTDPELF